MIIRSLGVRHGRRANAVTIVRACSRALSTEPTNASPDAISGSRQAAATPARTVPPPVLGFPPIAPRVSDPETPPPAPSYAPASGTNSSSATDTAVADHLAFLKLQKKISPLGTDIEQRYSPGDLVKNPPFPKDVTLELLLASQAHMGHHTSRWNPANARHVAGVRGGIHIIDLEATAAHLRRAARVVERVAHAGGLLLFVGTRKGQSPIVVRAAELAGGGACHLFDKWTPGTITNRDRMLEAAPLQVVDEHDRPLGGFDAHLSTRRPVVPDLVICLNPRENYTLLYECGLATIPTIGVIDTDADPTMVTYAIPANDDSLRCVAVIGGVLGRAAQLGRIRRLQDAKRGYVTWEMEKDVAKFVKSENMRKTEETKSMVSKRLRDPSVTENAGLFEQAGIEALREALENGLDEEATEQTP